MPSKRLRIGINGFGRIGRLCARQIILNESDKYELVLVNEIVGGAEMAAYLLQFDSIHGTFPRKCNAVSTSSSSKDPKDGISVEGLSNIVKVTSFSKIEDIPWAASKIDIALECTGKFVTVKSLQPYIDVGVPKVIVSAPVDNIPNIVVGCNDSIIKASDRIITCASCTTNCLAPIVKAVDEAFGIDYACMTTLHCVTNTQSIMDAVNKKKDDPRRARSGMTNLAPTSTGSAKAIGKIYPHLQGKINGIAVRVPLQNASITDVVFTVKKSVESAKAVNKILSEASAKMPTVLGFEERLLVSTDFVNDSRSGIVDAASTMAIGPNMIKIVAWYDNEFGYACRMIDLIPKVYPTPPSSKL